MWETRSVQITVQLPHDIAEQAEEVQKAEPDFLSRVAESQNYLGQAYVSGQGVPQNYRAAAMWFRKAAEWGKVWAQFYLGELYYSGQGVPQDYVEAHKWFNLAASRYRPGQERDRFASLRDDVAKRMTPEQIAEAQRLAREWKPGFLKREKK